MERRILRVRAPLIALASAGILCFALVGTAFAGPYTIGGLSQATGPSPFAPGCGGSGEGSATSFNFQDSEVEPWVAVDPTDASHMVAFWQQDRWSDGGAHGLVAGVTHDGGTSWTTSFPAFSRCAGAGPGDPGYFERSSDPWVSFSPNGVLYSIAISTDFSTARNAVLVSRSTTGGASWETPNTLKFDRARADVPLGTNFNDKESLTADPGDSSFAYAVWDRLVFPNERASAAAVEHTFAFRGPTWFSRTTNGGASWETARPIYDPGQQNQTISNQIVVRPDGGLVDGFVLIKQSQSDQKSRGFSVRIIRSPDNGETWSTPIKVAPFHAVGVTDPEPVHCRPFLSTNPLCTLVRTGDIVPDFAVDRTGGANNGNLYAVWQDHDSSPFGDDSIMFSSSTNGGTSWSAPVKVNDTPAGAYNTQAFTAAVDVRGDGDVAVTYYDMRDDAQGDGTLDTDYWIAHSHDAGQTWSASQKISGPFDMRSAPYARGYFVGDYEGLDNIGSLFEPFFVLANNGNQAFNDPNKTDGFLSSAG